MPASSPKISDDDTTPEFALVHADLSMEQAQAHYDTDMAEEEWPVRAPLSVFRQAHEELYRQFCKTTRSRRFTVT